MARTRDRMELEPHRSFLWNLCYRMSGSAADADDLVQETFVRALEHPPADTESPARPWLARVAANLARDLLRRRKRAGYAGSWLPSPVDTARLTTEPSPEARYDMLESVSTAFLVAAEALTPQQRAVLILRDVFDFSVRETSSALHLSEANVKTTLHRARRVMAAYDATRRRPVPFAQTGAVLQNFLQALGRADIDAIRGMLSESVRFVADGGGEYAAARLPVLGPENVSRFFGGILRKAAEVRSVQPRSLNGAPAVLIEAVSDNPRLAPRFTISVNIDEDGKIVEIDLVAATRKLTAV